MWPTNRTAPHHQGKKEKTTACRRFFVPRANLFYRAVLLGVPVLSLLGGYVWYQVYRSPIVTDVRMPIGQPVMFSHRHHSGELKIDCRYCHTSAEKVLVCRRAADCDVPHVPLAAF